MSKSYDAIIIGDPVSFTMHDTRRTCDIGFFSRRREINTDSSFSVIG